MEEELFNQQGTVVTSRLVTLHGDASYAVKNISSLQVTSLVQGSGGPVAGCLVGGGGGCVLFVSIMGIALSDKPNIAMWLLGGLGVFLLFMALLLGAQKQKKIWTLAIKLSSGQVVLFRNESEETIRALQGAITKAMAG